MCLLQNKPLYPEIAGICNKCCLYLSTCSPIVDHGMLFGECDMDFCDECPMYEDCNDKERMC